MKGEGGGAIYETMVHNLDLINWYFGKCNRVKVLSSSTVLPYRTINGRTVSTDADDCTLVELDMNGVKVFCHSDLISPGYMNYVEIHAENGSVFTSILYHLPTILFLKEQRGIYDQGNNFFTFEQTNTIQLELTHFLEAVKKKAKYLNSIDDSIKVMEIIDKIREQI